jgi:chromosome partitioning protein
MIVISLANQKGGVAKTTTNVNLAGIFAEQGYSVLIVDADPQCNSTSYFLDPNLPSNETLAAIYDDEITEQTVRQIIRPTRISRLDIAPGGFSLSARVWEIVQDRRSGLRLDQFLKQAAKHKKYDFVFIDCPPDIGIFTMGAFFASDYIFIPIQPERLSVEGVEQLMMKVQEFWKMRGENKPQILGTVTTMFHGQNRSHKEWAPKIDEICGDLMLGVIHRSSAISLMSDAGKLLLEDRPNRKARPFQQHLKIAKKMLDRLKATGELTRAS